MIYIHKTLRFWKREKSLPVSYKTGGSREDYDNGLFLLLSKEQEAFHEAHPEASPMEVWNMRLESAPIRTPSEARYEKIRQIEMYDCSEAVNSFIVNGVPAWLTPDVRANYKNSIEAAEVLGETSVTFIIAGIVATSTLQEARLMLAKIQRYADNCTIVTESHKARVNYLSSVQDIDAYDYTAGYPAKEAFEISQDNGGSNQEEGEAV